MPVRVHKLIESFLADITIVIPEQVNGCISIRDELKSDANNVIRRIVQHLGQHDEHIVSRDESFLNHDTAEVIPGIIIGPYWEEISQKSKDVVWNYLNLMLLAGAKHVRSLDRKQKKTKKNESSDVSAEDDISGNDLASEIAKRLRDPSVRDQVMDTIRETMESIPDESEDNNTNPFKAIEGIVSGLEETQIGKIVKEIAEDLSGEISPESLGLPADGDMEKMGVADIIGLISKPGLMQKIMGIVGKVGDNLKKRVESGEVDQEKLSEESLSMLTKSQDLLKHLSPQAAQMMAAMTGGKMNKRKMERMVKKMGGDGVLNALNSIGENTRTSSVKKRLRKKISERKSKNETETETVNNETVDNTNVNKPTSSETIPSKSHGKSKGKKKNKNKKHR
jgi:hypothetical protein